MPLKEAAGGTLRWRVLPTAFSGSNSQLVPITPTLLLQKKKQSDSDSDLAFPRTETETQTTETETQTGTRTHLYETEDGEVFEIIVEPEPQPPQQIHQTENNQTVTAATVTEVTDKVDNQTDHQPRPRPKPTSAPRLQTLQLQARPKCRPRPEPWPQPQQPMKSSRLSDTACCRDKGPCQEEHERVVRETKEILQRLCHRGQSTVQRSGKGKRQRSPTPQERPQQPYRQGRPGRSRKVANDDGKKEVTQVRVSKLRFSQLSCKETFQCGKSVSKLINDLCKQKVSLSEPFLRLTVFETTDEKTNEYILRCIDNRRLFALKEYAMRIGEDILVNINLFNQDTLMQCQRFIHNSDDTPGDNVKLRKGGGKRGRNRQGPGRQWRP